jgi:DNA-binding NarL/FixJ family response regulator
MTINVGIYDEHRIVNEALCQLIAQTEDFNAILSVYSEEQLLQAIKSVSVHVLVINIHALGLQQINLIKTISEKYGRIKILVVTSIKQDELVLKIIKSGAKGFLARESSHQELVEAIYALRNGLDYFSNSITHLLINRYIEKLKGEDKPQSVFKNLSSREIEIIQLWGNSHTNTEIADKLCISTRTVESHKSHIMQKLNLKTNVDLLKFAIRNNLIEV